MRKSAVFLLLALLIAIAGCQEDNLSGPVSPIGSMQESSDTELAALGLIQAAEWPLDEEAAPAPPADKGGLFRLVHFHRDLIVGDIAHYSVQIRVGPGQYDVIGLHRVVREDRPRKPIRTQKSIFMQHGSSKDFVGMWLPGLYSETTPDGFGMAVYLAQNDIDVWGIDQSWTLVPSSETDTSFMQYWGLDRQMGDLRVAVSVARLSRIFTGCGCAKMILAGYSNGIPTTVSLVNEETQLPQWLRNIGGYIPIDCPIKAEPGDLQAVLAGYSALYQSIWDAGVYGEEVFFAPLAELVRCCPDDPSPFDPTFTNEEYALFICCAPVLFPGHPFHYWAGILDESGMPTGLRFTPWELWLDFLASGTAYEPIIWSVDWTGYVAGTLDTPYDDHLGEIEVPILNITPAGGFAEATYYGLGLLGSSDIQTLMPSTGIPTLEEYAHIDIFTYEGSEQLVWQPMLEWIIDHTP